MFRNIDLRSFLERTGITSSDFSRLQCRGEVVASLRDIVEVRSMQAMSVRYLERLIRSVSLAGNTHIYPYANSKVEFVRMDPGALLVGQTFVERRKLHYILEDFGGIWTGFCVARGFAKRTALIVHGRTAMHDVAIAHYLPPIVEEYEGGLLLLDGVHRNYLAKSIGTTVETIVIRNVSEPFPCDCHSWDRVIPVDEKPSQTKRFHQLVPELFRDVKSVGIDG